MVRDRRVISGVASRYLATSSQLMSKYTWRRSGSLRMSSTITAWLGFHASGCAEDDCTGWTMRPSPMCAQMIVVFGCRRSSCFICPDGMVLARPMKVRGFSKKRLLRKALEPFAPFGPFEFAQVPITFEQYVIEANEQHFKISFTIRDELEIPEFS